ncbi:MAG: hypothetical protein H6737_24570 [Alphaproteobacteria bacterium]|nr:hypothetical protein [Alphaproteobacteria bacterium]
MVRTEQGSQVAAPAGAPPAERSPWIVSPGWDAFWILAGLWLWLIYAVVGPFELGVAAFGVLVAGQIVWATVHSFATTYTVVFSPIFAEARRERPGRFLGVPAAIFAASMALGIYVGIGPTMSSSRFTLENWGFALLLLAFFLGHFWHFAQQDFGVLSLYRARMAQFTENDRRADLYYTRLMTLVVQPIVYLYALYELPWSQLILSAAPISRETAHTAALGAIAVAIAASLGILVFEGLKPNRSIPKLYYLAIIAFHPLTLFYVPNGYGLVYAFVYLFSHWMVAISLAWRLNRNHAMKQENPGRALGIYVAGFGGLCFAASCIHWFLAPNYPMTAEAYLDVVGHLPLAAGIVLGYALGEQMVHYYCDRALFRFKDPFVRQNVGPLLR